MSSDCPSHQMELEETMHAQIGLIAPLIRFKKTLCTDLARMVMVDDATTYRFVITSVHEAILSVKLGALGARRRHSRSPST